MPKIAARAYALGQHVDSHFAVNRTGGQLDFQFIEGTSSKHLQVDLLEFTETLEVLAHAYRSGPRRGLLRQRPATRGSVDSTHGPLNITVKGPTLTLAAPFTMEVTLGGSRHYVPSTFHTDLTDFQETLDWCLRTQAPVLQAA